MKAVLFTILALVIADREASAQLWTADAGLVESIQPGSGSAELAWVGDQAMLVAGLYSLEGQAVTLAFGSDPSVRRSQFGVPDIRHLEIDAVLGSSALGMVVRGRERVLGTNERSFVALIDEQASLRWAIPGFADAALFLPGDIIAIRRGGRLQGVKANDGTLLWQRVFSDLVPVSGQAQVSAAIAPDKNLLVAATPSANGQVINPFLLVIDPTTGQTLQQWRAEPSLNLRGLRCEVAEVAGDVVLAWNQVGSSDLFVERRQLSDGLVLWRTRISSLPFEDGPCPLVANADVVALRSHQLNLGTDFIGMDANTGAIRWRQNLPFESFGRLTDLNDGGLLLSQTDQSAPAQLVVQRFRSSDGQLQWTQSFTSRLPSVRVSAAAIALASVESGTSANSLRVRQLSLADGSLIGERSEQTAAQRVLPAAASFVDGIPYLLSSGHGADQRQAHLQRLNADTGAVEWQTTLQLGSAPQHLQFAQLQSSADGGVFAAVSYLSGGTTSPTDVFKVSSAGTELYRYAFQPDSGYVLAGHDSGEASLRFVECVDIPTCNTLQSVLVRLDVAGAERWRVNNVSQLVAAVGTSSLVDDYNAEQLRLHDVAGATTWQIASSALATSSAVSNAQQVGIAQFDFGLSPTALLITALSRGSGTTLWSDYPPMPAGFGSGSGSIHVLADPGHWLVTGIATFPINTQQRFDLPVLASYDAGSGMRSALHTPSGGVDPYWVLRGPLAQRDGVIWMRGTRMLDGRNGGEQRRIAVARVDETSLQVEGEYLVARDYDQPLRGRPEAFPRVMASNGDLLLETETRGELVRKQLQRLPAVTAQVADLRVTLVDQVSPLRALGPSRIVAVRVQNLGASAAQNGLVGSAAPDGRAWAILRRCEVTAGSGQCPMQLDIASEQAFSLDSGAELILHYEVYTSSYVPQQPAGSPDSIYFHVEPPFGIGDADLGDNVVLARVNLGGFGNGFE